MKKPSLKIYFENNLKILKSMPANSVDLIYVDPPFNTGKKRSHSIMKNIQSDTGDRVGFQGKKYSTSTSNIFLSNSYFLCCSSINSSVNSFDLLFHLAKKCALIS